MHEHTNLTIPQPHLDSITPIFCKVFW